MSNPVTVVQGKKRIVLSAGQSLVIVNSDGSGHAVVPARTDAKIPGRIIATGVCNMLQDANCGLRKEALASGAAIVADGSFEIVEGSLDLRPN